jgi:serpin B
MKKSMMLLAVLAGCVPAEEEAKDRGQDPDPDPVEQCQPVDVAATPGAIAVADANNAFAMDMYGAVAEEAPTNDNLFFSPFSISSALGMTLAGMDGETAAQMRAVFHMGDDDAAHHAGYGELRQAVFAKGANCDATLNMANRLFGMEGYPWLQPFLDITAGDYGAPLEEIDFPADPDGARVYINDWVADQTEDRILDLLPEGSIKPITRLVLANAIYFQGDWEHAFDERNTRDATFTRADGSTVTTPIMYETVEARTAFAQGIIAVELDYQGGNQSMVVMMPEDPETDLAPASAFDLALVEEIEDSLVSAGDVWLGLPRFSFAQETSLMEVLISMGMVDAFEEGVADLTRMTDPSVTGEPLYIGGAYHKAFVAVDETGTEAAAATAVVVDAETAAMGTEFTADRPFEFYIRDNVSGSILFMGRVHDPSAE